MYHDNCTVEHHETQGGERFLQQLLKKSQIPHELIDREQWVL